MSCGSLLGGATGFADAFATVTTFFPKAARIVNRPELSVWAEANLAPSLPIKPTAALSTGLPSSVMVPLTATVPASPPPPPHPLRDIVARTAPPNSEALAARFRLKSMCADPFVPLGHIDGFLIRFVAQI